MCIVVGWTEPLAFDAAGVAVVDTADASTADVVIVCIAVVVVVIATISVFVAANLVTIAVAAAMQRQCAVSFVIIASVATIIATITATYNACRYCTEMGTGANAVQAPDRAPTGCTVFDQVQLRLAGVPAVAILFVKRTSCSGTANRAGPTTAGGRVQILLPIVNSFAEHLVEGVKFCLTLLNAFLQKPCIDNTEMIAFHAIYVHFCKCVILVLLLLVFLLVTSGFVLAVFGVAVVMIAQQRCTIATYEWPTIVKRLCNPPVWRKP